MLVVPRMTALGLSAVGHLMVYKLSEWLWGASTERALWFFQHWGRRACAWLRVEVQVRGGAYGPPCIYVCNHRSHLDIPLLAWALGTTFLSRADVATWPLVGAAARATAAVFVDREDPYSRARAARALHRHMRTASIVVFPEGTTAGGTLPGRFQVGLFRLVRRLNRPIVPVTIRYSHRTAYWADDTPFGTHLRVQVLGGPRLSSVIHIGQPIACAEYPDAAALSQAVYRAICRPIEELGELVGDREYPWGTGAPPALGGNAPQALAGSAH